MRWSRLNDGDMSKWRHLIENRFAKIKESRDIATRYDKTDTSYAVDLNSLAFVLRFLRKVSFRLPIVY